MYKTKNKITRASNSQQKRLPPKPRPEFSTDFVDRQKYKLSESEMIQKKASLQSKHRQEAIVQLQERRRKLEMGLIDDDTRKVYETALTSKKIDINPVIRKNLSQMIQYERDQNKISKKDSRPRNHSQDQEEEEDDCENEEYEKQLKETQAFIKKFEKAKKMDKIERAIDMLSQPAVKPESAKKNKPKKEGSKEKERTIFQNERLTNNVLNIKESTTSNLNTSSHEQVLSSIEDTIKFMEQRLFSSSRIDKIKKQKSQESSQRNTESLSNLKSQNFHQQSASDISLKIYEANADNTEGKFYKNMLEISHLKMSNDISEDQNECLDTIRRMKQMIEDRQPHLQPVFKKNMKENIDFVNTRQPIQNLSTFQKNNTHRTESQAEIDFSLTMNNSLQNSVGESIQKNSNKFNQKQFYSGQFGVKSEDKSQNEDEQYERIKKSLFEEVNKLQLNSFHSEEPSFQAKTSIHDRPVINDESTITNLQFNPTPSTNKKAFKKPNAQLQRLKNQINGTTNSVESIKIETFQLPRNNEIIGLDFRGSINIKRNIIQK